MYIFSGGSSDHRICENDNVMAPFLFSVQVIRFVAPSLVYH